MDTIRNTFRLAIATLTSSARGSVQRELAEAVLSHPFGELRPLEWQYNGYTWFAEIGYGRYKTGPSKQTWHLVLNGCDGAADSEAGGFCDDVEHGKRLCEEHYEATVAKMFRPLGEK